MLDVHLAQLYEVETKALKRAVKRNKNRFPVDFVFQPQMILSTFLFAVLLSTAASLGPALGAARVKIGSTLRYG